MALLAKTLAWVGNTKKSYYDHQWSLLPIGYDILPIVAGKRRHVFRYFTKGFSSLVAALSTETLSSNWNQS